MADTDAFNPNNMKKRFKELQKEREDILKVSMPLREERDRVQNEAGDRVRGMNSRIKEVEAKLFDIDQESAALARALGGRTAE